VHRHGVKAPFFLSLQFENVVVEARSGCENTRNRFVEMLKNRESREIVAVVLSTDLIAFYLSSMDRFWWANAPNRTRSALRKQSVYPTSPREMDSGPIMPFSRERRR